ncbi:MAG: polysaccharide deacetylase family protein [Chthoniobacterales bacterium]
MIRASLIGFAFLAPIISIALAASGTNIILSLAPLFVSHLLLLYATLVPASQWWGPVITRFATNGDEVWLTIDDGPSPAHTMQILDLLKQFDARATFFVIGQRAEQHPHLITEILTRGHTVANHTFTHPSGRFWCAGPAKIRNEIDRCAETLRTTPERPALFFRSPVGIKNMFVHPALTRRGLKLIGWSVRGLDTIKRDPQRVVDRIERFVRPGAIILLHEGQRTEKQPEFNIRCVELTLQRLTNRGFRFVIPRPEQLQTRCVGKCTDSC